MEEQIRNNDSGTHEPAHAPRTHAHSGDADSNAMYVLPFAVIIGMLILSIAIYFSAGGIISAIDATDFNSKVAFNGQGYAAQPQAQAAPAQAPAQRPSAAPSPSIPSAGGCGVPAGAPGSPAGAVANIDVSGRPVRGSPNAPVTIVEFSDFECPFCQRAEPTVRQIMNDYNGKVKLVYMQFPLSFHPNAQKAAEASECAGDQGKFWEYNDRLFDTKQLDVASLKQHAAGLGLDTAKFNACLDGGAKSSAVGAQAAMGSQNGVSGTPSFFINGKPIVGAQPYENFKAIIDAELAK